MKVIQINCVYNNGSTGKIVYDIHKYLCEKGIQSLVLYGRGKRIESPNVIKVSSEWEAKIHSVVTRITGVDFAYSPMATQNAINIISKEQPDVVHLHCLNGHFINIYRILGYLKKSNIQTILTLHAEIMHTAGCEHAIECEKWRKQCSDCSAVRGLLTHYFRDDANYCFNLMKEAISGFRSLKVVGVSDWLTERAKNSAIFMNNSCEFCTVKNGLDTAVFYPRDVSELKESIDAQNSVVLLHVTPDFNHPIKGGKYVIELAKRHPEWTIVIVGFNGDIETLPNNIIPVENTTNQNQLAEYYSLADATILTSKRETFSMVCAESLCCGTPVVGFKAGGPESICIPEYSMFVEYGNINELDNAVRSILNRRITVNREQTKIYRKEEMAENYLHLYRGQ